MNIKTVNNLSELSDQLEFLLSTADIKVTPLLLRKDGFGSLEIVCDITASVGSEPEWPGFGKFTIPWFNPPANDIDREVLQL